jgi:YVTN family beta-propeller protein
MKKNRVGLGFGLLVIALLVGLMPTSEIGASRASANNPPYVVTTIPVGEHPKGITVNWSINRVYVAMFDGSCIQTVNGSDLTLGTCAYSQGLHPNQLSLWGFDRLYVTNRDSDSVSLLDANSMQVLGWIPTGKLPWSVIAANDRVFVGDFAASRISVFDLNLESLLATIPLPQDAPGLMTFGYWGVYVPGWNTGALYAVNTRDNSLTAPASIGPGAFAVAENQYTREIFVGNRLDNTLHVFAKDGFYPLRTIQLPGPPYGIAVNPKTSRLFVVDALNDVVNVLDTTSGQLLTQLGVGHQDQDEGGQGIAINLETNRVYVTNYADGSLTVIQDVYPNATPTPTPSPSHTPTPPTASCTTRPSKPILLSPPNVAQLPLGPVKIDWQEVACADYYRLKVIESPPRRVYLKIDLIETEYTFSGLSPGMRYVWKVRACNAFGCGDARKWSFTIHP